MCLILLCEYIIWDECLSYFQLFCPESHLAGTIDCVSTIRLPFFGHYFVILDSRLRCRKWTAEDMAASNAYFWMGTCWDTG